MAEGFRMRLPAILLALCSPLLFAQRAADLTTPTPVPAGSTLVIGFLGGFDRWDDPHRSIRQLTLRLRERSGIYAESISNHHRALAMDLIRRALDTNRNGMLDAQERKTARIILYGQSWGGAAVIATARDLDQLGIPVLLTVQVDSVGRHDAIVPDNVHAAVNFYQHDASTIIRGKTQIRAADPARTQILGNFRSSYAGRFIDTRNASWLRRTIGGSHVRMELDPAVWGEVEHYITEAINTEAINGRDHDAQSSSHPAVRNAPVGAVPPAGP